MQVSNCDLFHLILLSVTAQNYFLKSTFLFKLRHLVMEVNIIDTNRPPIM